MTARRNKPEVQREFAVRIERLKLRKEVSKLKGRSNSLARDLRKAVRVAEDALLMAGKNYLVACSGEFSILSKGLDSIRSRNRRICK